MNEKIKILIVEDELIISENLKIHLEENQNYSVIAQEIRYEKAVIAIEELRPDIVLLDINIKGEKTGIDVGKFLNNNFPEIVFIYLTSYMDSATIEKAKETFPAGYLNKPFNYNSVHSTIEIAYNNFCNFKRKFIVDIKDGKKIVRLDVKKILYIKSDDNYIDIQTINRKITVRNTLSEILELLPSVKFIQINRSTIINRDFIQELKNNSVFINNEELKISKTYRHYFD